jgi:hypothetical protein
MLLNGLFVQIPSGCSGFLEKSMRGNLRKYSGHYTAIGHVQFMHDMSHLCKMLSVILLQVAEYILNTESQKTPIYLQILVTIIMYELVESSGVE